MIVHVKAYTVLWIWNNFAFILQSRGSQSVVLGEAAPAAPGNVVNIVHLGPTADMLNRKLEVAVSK